MAIKIGSTDIADVKVGTTQVEKIYLGSTEVWSHTPVIKAVCFSSTGAQTLTVDDTKLGTLTPSLEYSLDDGATWTSWNPTSGGTTPISFGNGTDLYLRGMNLSLAKYTSDGAIYTQFVFSTSSPVACSGNIMHLLDYTQDLTTFPTGTSDYRGFRNLFFGCNVLTTPPDLPATVLNQTQCYMGMFQDCTNLVVAPALPATTIINYCYQNMFSGCSSLTTPPALPSTQNSNSCYRSMFLNCTSLSAIPYLNTASAPNTGFRDMFNGCSLIKMSDTQTGEYQNEYGFQFTPSTWSANGMFSNTGGTFTGTPTQQTYYTSNSVIGAPAS